MEHSTLAHQCFEEIRKKIVSGEIPPGEKLAVQSLSQALHVGPTPVREALSRLTNTGLVEVMENKGFRVSSFSKEKLQDLYETYCHLDCLALELSIKKGDEAWESQVIASLYQLALIENQPALTIEQFPKWCQRNEQFHTALSSGCGSPCLLQLRDHLQAQFERYFHLAFQKSTASLIPDHNSHKALADAALARNKKEAIQILKAHSIEGMKTVIQNCKFS